jgi:hypothetical protein
MDQVNAVGDFSEENECVPLKQRKSVCVIKHHGHNGSNEDDVNKVGPLIVDQRNIWIIHNEQDDSSIEIEQKNDRDKNHPKQLG